MPNHSELPSNLTRRSALGLLGAGVALACSGASEGDANNSGGAGNGTAGAGTSGAGTSGNASTAGSGTAGSATTGGGSAGATNTAGGGASGSAGADAAGAGGTAGATEAGAAGQAGATGSATCELFKGWAAGGTKCMTGAGSYPNPFGLTATSCPTSPEATIGPCHTTSPLRVDISDGLVGIPMRMALRVVDSNCKPVPGAIVEVWHTNYKGGYSGDIVQMCTLEAADKAKVFCRGYQVADSSGVVHFDSCFPGWYRGRALHVHVRILKTAYAAADNAPAASITQLLWSDAFVDGIFKDVPLYAAFGLPDTHLSNDNVVGDAADKSVFLFDTQQMADGTMLCSKTLIIGA